MQGSFISLVVRYPSSSLTIERHDRNKVHLSQDKSSLNVEREHQDVVCICSVSRGCLYMHVTLAAGQPSVDTCCRRPPVLSCAGDNEERVSICLCFVLSGSHSTVFAFLLCVHISYLISDPHLPLHVSLTM